MITVIFYGLDQYLVGRLSRDLTPSIAKLYEVDEEQINFIAPQNMVFHNGVEQTSWNVIIHVHAPMKVSVLQDQVAKYILTAVGDIAIHKAIEFYYYSQDSRFELINDDYPRFITEENSVEIEEHDDCCCDEDHEEGDEDEEIYTGDIFEDFSHRQGNK